LNHLLDAAAALPDGSLEPTRDYTHLREQKEQTSKEEEVIGIGMKQVHHLLSSPSSDIRVAVTTHHGVQSVDEAGHVDVDFSRTL
jgi:hypothetical protein